MTSTNFSTIHQLCSGTSARFWTRRITRLPSSRPASTALKNICVLRTGRAFFLWQGQKTPMAMKVCCSSVLHHRLPISLIVIPPAD